MPQHIRLVTCHFLRSLLCGTLLFAFSLHLAAQEVSDTPQEEIVANLAAGRVVIAVVKDAILIATVEDPIEAQTRVPTPVPVSDMRIGVILGADEWFSPSTLEELARLDAELPRIRAQTASTAPRLEPPGEGSQATDIQSIGQGLLERLSDLAKGLHGKIRLPEGEPIAELIIADYLQGYGPEVWQVTYAIEQQEERADYWDTRVPQPRYLQFWPPEKGQPHTLVEFFYPPQSGSPTLLDMLRQKDPRIEKAVMSDSKIWEVADQFLKGESQKVSAADATQFLRAALEAIAPPKARQTMAVLSAETGFHWILPPPPEPKKPGPPKQRPPGAPTLIKPPSSR